MVTKNSLHFSKHKKSFITLTKKLQNFAKILMQVRLNKLSLSYANNYSVSSAKKLKLPRKNVLTRFCVSVTK